MSNNTTPIPSIQETVFCTLRKSKNGNAELRILSNQWVKNVVGKIVELQTQKVQLRKSAGGAVIDITNIQYGDVIASAEIVEYSTYTQFCNPVMLLRKDGSKVDDIPIASATTHIFYDHYLSNCDADEENEESPPRLTKTQSYYQKLIKKAIVPTIETDDFYVDKDTWYYLVRNIQRGKPTLITGPSGTGKTELVALACKHLKKNLHTIDMSGMTDPIAGLIGVHRLGSTDVGSYFDFSRFSEAVQDEDGVVLLDELNRAALESANILLPVTDVRRQLYCDVASKNVPRIIDVKAAIIATANVGFEYVGVSSIDRALLDRFNQIELNMLSKEHESLLLQKRHEVSKYNGDKIVEVIDDIRTLYTKNEISTFISTRYSLEIASLVSDGWDLIDAFSLIIYPLFLGTLTESGERNTVHLVVKKYLAA